MFFFLAVWFATATNFQPLCQKDRYLLHLQQDAFQKQNSKTNAWQTLAQLCFDMCCHSVQQAPGLCWRRRTLAVTINHRHPKPHTLDPSQWKHIFEPYTKTFEHLNFSPWLVGVLKSNGTGPNEILKSAAWPALPKCAVNPQRNHYAWPSWYFNLSSPNESSKVTVRTGQCSN